jgi:hypothetical protein
MKKWDERKRPDEGCEDTPTRARARTHSVPYKAPESMKVALRD